MKTTLIIMAAGIGSRFGQGIKQLEVMNPHNDGSKGEIIIDYSIYDAVEAGFNKVVFVIRKAIEKEFKEVIGDRIEESLKKQNIEVAYAFQELEDIPEGFSIPEGRVKPWGTGQAVLSCKSIVQEPFLIINADDYYGKEAFQSLHKFLVSHANREENKMSMAMAGFILENTLSKNGAVTRGVCISDEKGYLLEVLETEGIYAKGDHVFCEDKEREKILSLDSLVSMNMWAGYPDFLEFLEKDFPRFLKEKTDNELKKEYLIPIIVDGLLKKGEVSVQVLKTEDQWIGITYKDDADFARKEFKKMIEDGIYPSKLWV